jgi:Spy/CpxP family protein refolding chaperone
MIKGPILALAVASFFIAPRHSLCANAGTDVVQMGPGVRAPNLETLQIGLEDTLDRLTHAQREQVEQIMAGEALQLQMARGNQNLSVARVFSQEQTIRVQTRRQIASILSPKQKQKVIKLMTRRAVKLENRANDY